MNRPARRLAAVGLVVAALAAGCGDDDATTGERPAVESAADDVAPDHLFTIPAGTGDRMDAGADVAIIPAELTVHVGEVLRIVNNDARGHTVGAFYVGAGETLTQRFASPGVLSGECSVHPSGSFELTVEE